MNEVVDLLIFSGISSGSESLAGFVKPWRSIGPSKIANRLRQAGYRVQIINFATLFSYEDLRQLSDRFIGDQTIIGISTTFLSNNTLTLSSLSQAVAFYKSKFSCKVLLGGPSPGLFSKVFSADFLIAGYAENKILELLNSVNNRMIVKKINPSWEINSCSHRWHESDHVQPGETLPLEIGRGCIFKCSYCKFEMTGKKKGEYVRDLSLIKDEIIFNYEKYKTTNYMIMDDTFNDDFTKIENWCRMVDELPFKIQYAAYCRADLLHRYQDLARELSRTGLRGAVLGIESMNSKAALSIGKSWSATKGKEFLPELIHNIFDKKSITQLNFIIGLPGDTEKNIWDWLFWCKDNEIPVAVAQPLSIRPPKLFPTDSVYSDFDKHAEDVYGYRFPYAGRPHMWESDDITWMAAQKLYKKTTDYITNNFCDFTWSSFASLSLGFELEDIKGTSSKKFYSNSLYTNATEAWINAYKSSILS